MLQWGSRRGGVLVWSQRYIAARVEFPHRLDEQEEGCKKKIRLQRNPCTNRVEIPVML